VHDEIEKSIYSIAPADRQISIERDLVTGLKLDRIMDYADHFGRKMKKLTGRSQDEAIDELKVRLKEASEHSSWLHVGGEKRQDVIKIHLSYNKGGTSDMCYAAFYFQKVSETACNVAHAYYGEQWTEQSHVNLVKGKWPDDKITKFLTWRLIQRLPLGWHNVNKKYLKNGGGANVEEVS